MKTETQEISLSLLEANNGQIKGLPKNPSNGGRIHHRIMYEYLAPKIIRNAGGRSNIEWDTYPEDFPFTNEPKRIVTLNDR